MPKLITVFGANGRQGWSVVEALLRDSEFNVRAAVEHQRDSRQINTLETVQCNLNNKDAVKNALIGSYGCFVLTRTDVARSDAFEKEVQEGKIIADACAHHNVQHVVISTQLNTQRALGILARNMVAKATIEDYMRDIGLPVTGLIVPIYYEHFLDIFKPSQIGPNEYEIAIPMGTHCLDTISVTDVGEVARHIFTNRTQYLTKTLSLSGDKLTVREMAAILSRQLSPKKFKDKQITVNEYQYLGFPWCRDFAVMFDFFCRADQRYNINSTKGINSGLQSFEEWVKGHGSELCQVLDQSTVSNSPLFDWT